MALTEPQIDRVWAEMMRYWSKNQITVGALTKAQIREVVVTTVNWIDANTASFNTSIPQPQRGILSTDQKYQIFAYVLRIMMNDL